jgi:hypothetical protein
MTALFHKPRPLTLGLIAAIGDAGVLVGDGVKPSGSGWQGASGSSTFKPYVVLSSLGGGSSGDLDNPNGDSEPQYQTALFAATVAQAEGVIDRVRSAILDATYTLPGRKNIGVVLDYGGLMSRDDDVQPPVWSLIDRWRFFTVPA